MGDHTLIDPPPNGPIGPPGMRNVVRFRGVYGSAINLKTPRIPFKVIAITAIIQILLTMQQMITIISTPTKLLQCFQFCKKLISTKQFEPKSLNKWCNYVFYHSPYPRIF